MFSEREIEELFTGGDAEYMDETLNLDLDEFEGGFETVHPKSPKSKSPVPEPKPEESDDIFEETEEDIFETDDPEPETEQTGGAPKPKIRSEAVQKVIRDLTTDITL